MSTALCNLAQFLFFVVDETLARRGERIKAYSVAATVSLTVEVLEKTDWPSAQNAKRSSPSAITSSDAMLVSLKP